MLKETCHLHMMNRTRLLRIERYTMEYRYGIMCTRYSSFNHSVATNIYHSPPPTPPFSTHDMNGSNYWTLLSTYSSNTDALYNLIMEQAFYPPTYHVQIHGTHMEKRVGRDGKDRVTDFLLRLNLAPYLKRDGQVRFRFERWARLTDACQKADDVLEFLPTNKRGYRGTRFPSLKPVLGDDRKCQWYRTWGHYLTLS